MSANPDFFEFMRKGLGKRLHDLRHSGAVADERTIKALGMEVLAEATIAGLCSELSDDDRDSVVSRVCTYFSRRGNTSARRTATNSNQKLWNYLLPYSRRLALTSARGNGGVPDPVFLNRELLKLVEAYRAKPGCAALDDDADGVVGRLVAYRAKWRPGAKVLKPPASRHGATAAARRALTQSVTDLVDYTSGPDPALYSNLHKDRPTLVISTGKHGQVGGRRTRLMRPSSGAIHDVIAERATRQTQPAPSRSAVAAVIRKRYGAPDRDARLLALPASSQRAYHILAASLPDKRISTINAVELSEQMWGVATCASTRRSHRKRLRDALSILTGARVDLNAAIIDELVVVGRGRKLPNDLNRVALGKLRTIDAGRVTYESGIWATREGEVAKAFLRLIAQQAKADDVELIMRFQGSEATAFALSILRRDPKGLQNPIAYLEEVVRAASHSIYQPSVAQSLRGMRPAVGWPEAVSAAEDLLAVVEAVSEKESLIAGWRLLCAASRGDPGRIEALGCTITQIEDPETLDRFLTPIRR